MFDYIDWDNQVSEPNKFNEPVLREMIDRHFPIPQDFTTNFLDCFFGESSDSFYDPEDLYF
jgi:hypothetical protein